MIARRTISALAIDAHPRGVQSLAALLSLSLLGALLLICP